MNRRSSRPFRSFRSFRTALVGLAVGGLLLGAVGCSSSGGGGGSSSPAVHSPAAHSPAASSPAASSPAASSPAASSAPAGAVTVTIKDFKFGPATLTVAPGTTITVTNQDSAGHTLTAIAPNPGAFDTGLLEQGKSATITAPTAPGSYPFHCDVHPTMTGTLVVQ
ncbi:cupredoxin domain-containing protein [Kitasatospora purpeofusca]|uniref:cupredoxin domain-containing protein n=1 Tax=Kitasatospora purpeofusca TaxID=67352 RepID=UPI00224CE5A8|nr:cupredoxin domain-containing protein [Kitasatospora purpeofusca]MCX4752138.1 cupredoxin domain-containing protein [Kitasatospora purpeofusca]WSR31734.1 cupredoxin domain-containing protein [Kitasatospora purpeofusca]